MEEGSIFMSRGSQAMRLPNAVAFPDTVRKVDVVVLGNSRLLFPADEAWETWFDSPGVSADFMIERDQPADQERDPL